ncbi:Hypothetical Protein FCC1311_108832 [Hondaea fermentalgiana]|uniref:Uncharacterized protein n=1 Tax=Hondaea fermentalgiana TaxID=2315210 RepID=A0A2R5H1H9_9STRA|nr:Hypothetical Protein FCC1311_108832 [Hondaea fermentalgiana]|eukprot:GBG34661.1 Hypothetical Protein FCC1311_108832 [Hondaea fermentalgiana]
MRSVATAAVVLSLALSAQAQTDSCEITLDTIDWSTTNPLGLSGCGSTPVSFGGCCGNVLQDSEDTCSVVVYESAACEDSDEGCATYVPNATDSVTFSFEWAYSSTETCCEKCKCYGDPLCEAFDGTTDQMIECDGRNFTSCKMEQSICREQFDHAGNRCKWLKGNLNYPWWNSNLEDGSPCQADYNVSGQLELPLLEIDGLSMRGSSSWPETL